MEEASRILIMKPKSKKSKKTFLSLAGVFKVKKPIKAEKIRNIINYSSGKK